MAYFFVTDVRFSEGGWTLEELGVGRQSPSPLKASSSLGSAAKDEPTNQTKGLPALHPDVAAALTAAEAKEADSHKAAKEAATSALVSEIQSALNDGSLPPRRLEQRLRPRVFVIDFDV